MYKEELARILWIPRILANTKAPFMDLQAFVLTVKYTTSMETVIDNTENPSGNTANISTVQSFPNGGGSK